MVTSAAATLSNHIQALAGIRQAGTGKSAPKQVHANDTVSQNYST